MCSGLAGGQFLELQRDGDRIEVVHDESVVHELR